MKDWHSRFTYDESLPSCLRGKPSTRNPNGLPRGSFSKTSPYYRVKFHGKMYLAHRVIWEMHTGEVIGPEMQIDHLDGNIHNNKITNLRLVTRSLNCRNKRMRKDNTTGEQGICLQGTTRGHFYYVFEWTNGEGTRCRERFSCHTLGNDIAFAKAVEFKRSIMEKLREDGYTERHTG